MCSFLTQILTNLGYQQKIETFDNLKNKMNEFSKIMRENYLKNL